MEKPKVPEPWLRGTLTDVPPVQRAPIAFHIRHIGRATDRLLTYAEGNPLTAEQISAMKAELTPGATRDQLFAELNQALDAAAKRIRALSVEDLNHPRTVGRQQMPTTVGGLLVHVADHTQRHVGQAITTAKIVKRSA